MDDWSAFSDEMKEASQLRRADNRKNSAAVLVERGVSFVTMNKGAHLIVSHDGKVADFWPGTGKYRVRPDGDYKRGVFRMMRDLGVPDNGEAKRCVQTRSPT